MKPLSNNSYIWILSSYNSTGAILCGVIKMGDVLGCNSIQKSTSLYGGNPDNSSRKTSSYSQTVTPPTRHTVSSEGVNLFFFYKLITFNLFHSYNVKHLTCTIFYSSGLQNIYKIHIWKYSTFTIVKLLTKNKTYTNIDQKIFSWHLVVCWPWLLMWSVQTSRFCFSCTYMDETPLLSL